MTWRVIVGTLAFVGTMVVLGFVLLTESSRMESFDQAYGSRQIEVGAALFETSCTRCHGARGQGIPDVAPAINAADLFNGERLSAIGWAGSVEDYVRLTIAAGRPRPTEGTNYPDRMPTWGQQYGGPLRQDQIEALVAFIMNWGVSGGLVAPTPIAPEDAVGTDITRELPAGDAARGQALAEQLGCVACHVTSTAGPAWIGTEQEPGIGTRAQTRFATDGYTGQATSAEQYLFESLVLPNAYVVSGYNLDVMPQTFGERLTPQDTADLIAYLSTLK